MPHEVPVRPVEPLRGPPRLGADRRGLPLAAPGEGGAEPRRVAGMPAGFDEDAPRVGVPGLGNTPALFPVARGRLTRDKAEVGHELARGPEALEVPDLDEQGHGGQGVDPAEAAEPAHRLPIRRRLRKRRDLAIQVRHPGEELFDGPPVLLGGPVERREGEPLRPEPGPVALRPVAPVPVHPPVAGEELQEAVAPPPEVLLGVFPAADEIADRFAGLIGHVDRGQLPGPEEADQLRRIPAVGLDAVPGPAR